MPRLVFFLFVLSSCAATAQCNCSIRILGFDAFAFDSITFANADTPQAAQKILPSSKECLIDGLCGGTYVIQGWQSNIVVGQQIVDIMIQRDAVVKLASSTILPTVAVQRSANTPLQRLYLRDHPDQQGQVLAKLMESMPGMTSLQTGGRVAKPMFFGFTGQRLVILKNSLRLEGQQWGMDHGPEINPLYASRVDIWHGAKAIFMAGDGVGGVIQLSPPLRNDSLHWAINWQQSYRTNGQHFSQAIDLRHQPRFLPGIQFRVVASLAKAGTVSTPNVRLANTGFGENSIDMGLQFHRKKSTIDVEHGLYATRIGIFSGAHNGNTTDLMQQIERNPFPSADFSFHINRPFQQIYHENSSLQYAYKHSAQWEFTAILARQYDERKEFDAPHTRNDSIAALDCAALDLNLTNYQTEAQITYKWYTSTSLHFSIGHHRIINTFDGLFYIPNYQRLTTHGALYFQHQWDKNALQGTLRYDQLEQTVFRNKNNEVLSFHQQYRQPAWGLSYFYKPTTSHHFAAHLTYNNRPPTINERFANGLHHGIALYEIGEINLLQEYAYRCLMTYQFTKKNLQISAQGLAQHMDNFIHSVPSQEPILTIRGAFPVAQYAQNNARLFGLTVTAEYNLHSKWTLGMFTQILRAHIEPTNITPAYTPGDQYRTNIRFRMIDRKQLNAALSYHLNYFQKQWRISNDAEILAPPSNAFVHAVQLNCEFQNNKRQINFGVGIENLFNTTYRMYTDRMRYFHDAMGRNMHIYFNIPINISK